MSTETTAWTSPGPCGCCGTCTCADGAMPSQITLTFTDNLSGYGTNTATLYRSNGSCTTWQNWNNVTHTQNNLGCDRIQIGCGPVVGGAGWRILLGENNPGCPVYGLADLPAPTCCPSFGIDCGTGIVVGSGGSSNTLLSVTGNCEPGWYCVSGSCADYAGRPCAASDYAFNPVYAEEEDCVAVCTNTGYWCGTPSPSEGADDCGNEIGAVCTYSAAGPPTTPGYTWGTVPAATAAKCALTCQGAGYYCVSPAGSGDIGHCAYFAGCPDPGTWDQLDGPYLTSAECTAAGCGALFAPAPRMAAARPPRAARGLRPVAPPRPVGGPGTELKALLAGLGVTATAGCGCNDTAARMDAMGAAGCRERAGEIADQLRGQAKAVGWGVRLGAAVRSVAAGLVLNPLDPYPGLVAEAIRRAEAKQG